jgi:hypothetical protein
MKTSGWIVLITTWGIILSMFAFSFVKILRENDKDPDNDSTHNG